MKKKYLLLLAVVTAIVAGVLVWFAVLPAGPGVTKANFNRIKVGMTTTEVVMIFGEAPDEPLVNRWFPNEYFDREWRAADGSSAWVKFKYDRVVIMHWIDSTETLWDKLRRWIGLK